MKYFLTFAIVALYSCKVSAQNSYDVFYSIEDAIESESQFIELDLSSQGLVKLPVEVFQISNLKSLNLSNNVLLDISSSLDSLKNITSLETIKLNELNLRYIPFELFDIKNLKYLVIENNNIETIPDEIKGMYNLKGLFISNNNVDYIQSGFMHLSKLEVLDLRKNSDYDRKTVFYFASLMKSLNDLRVDCEDGLNSEISSLTNLKKLTLHRPNIKKDYELLSSLNGIKELVIEDGVVVDYKKLFTALSESEIEKLTISDNSIIKLDESISNLTHLKFFSISSWNLTSFPESISSLDNLSEVVFYDTPNMLNDQTIAKLNSQKISSLEINKCNRKKLPDELKQFSNLQKLNISNNDITVFNDLSNNNLEELIFFDNKVTSLEINLLKERMPNCQLIYEENESAEAAILAVKGVSPPDENLDIPFQSYKVDSQTSSTLEYSSGSVINVPENAFLDKSGKVVTGSVDLTYREFNDPMEIAFSGIPMGYDSLGVVYPFQSSGMVEIRASQNGEELFVNPDSKIRIDMVSNSSSSIFNLYSMADGEGWELKGKDSIASRDGSEIIRERFQYNNNLSTIPKPTIPVVKSGVTLLDFGNKKKYRKKGHIRIYSTHYNYRLVAFMEKKEMSIKSFNELKEFNKYSWKLDGMDLKSEINRYDSLNQFVQKFNDRMYDWRNSQGDVDSISKQYKLLAGANLIEDFWVEPNLKSDNFNLKILVCGDTNTFEIIPVINSSNPKTIQRKFKFIFSKYNKALEKRRTIWAEIDKFHGNYLEKYRAEMEKYQKDLIAFYEDRDAFLANKRQELSNYEASSYNFTRSFSIDGFGYWNCDVINRMDSPKPLLAKMYDKELNKLNIRELLIADITNNGVLRYDTGGKRIYDSKSKNAIIAFLTNGEIGLLTPDEVESTKLYSAKEEAKFEVFKSDEITIGEIKEKIGMPIN